MVGVQRKLRMRRGFEDGGYVQDVLYAGVAGAKTGDAATAEKVHF